MFGKKSKNIAQNIETEDITVVNDTSTQDVINESSTAEVKNKSEENDAIEDNSSNITTDKVNLEKKEEQPMASEDDITEDAEKPKDLILYIIMDKSNPSTLQYYRECGVNVSKIFTNINDAKDTLLMQINPVKILIVDTGTGRFSAMGSRKELLDLMGICDEDARISVYYTDTVIKSEVEYNESFEERNIHWHRFKSNTDVVAHLLKNIGKENYIYDNEDKDKISETPENILDFTGFKFDEPKQINIGEPSITLNDIKVHMVDNESTEDEIEGYNIVKI
jgi:hypothetical protein